MGGGEVGGGFSETADKIRRHDSFQWQVDGYMARRLRCWPSLWKVARLRHESIATGYALLHS